MSNGLWLNLVFYPKHHKKPGWIYSIPPYRVPDKRYVSNTYCIECFMTSSISFHPYARKGGKKKKQQTCIMLFFSCLCNKGAASWAHHVLFIYFKWLLSTKWAKIIDGLQFWKLSLEIRVKKQKHSHHRYTFYRTTPRMTSPSNRSQLSIVLKSTGWLLVPSSRFTGRHTQKKQQQQKTESSNT